MTYTREQDEEALIKCLRTGKPQRRPLIKRILKKYGAIPGILLGIDALFKIKKSVKKK